MENIALPHPAIIAPIDKDVLKTELNQCEYLCATHLGNRDIYITNHHTTPNIMRELGRLREISFGAAGGGSGNDCDIDQYDIAPEPHCYNQLFVWDKEDEEIIGGYRYIQGSNIFAQTDDSLFSATAGLFAFTDFFRQQYLPYTIELGRSFVRPDYQPLANPKKGIYSLDNLWEGVGALARKHTHIKYFFGKITMYPSMNALAKDYILYFYQKHFPDNEGMVYPIEPVEILTDYNSLVKLFNGRSYKEDYHILVRSVRALGEKIPPLVNAYMNLSSTMRSFGTAVNRHFSHVEETGILVTIADLYPDKYARYINPQP